MIFNKLIKREADVFQLVVDSLEIQQGILLTYFNQHCFNIYNTNLKYKNLIDNTFTVFLDGYGVYSALKFLGYKNIEKFNATDLYDKILQYFSANHTRLFLIGGNFSEDLINKKANEKKIIITGYNNGYFKLDKLDLIIKNISRVLPEVIIIGMGVPEQERLAAKIASSIQDKTILCVGNFLEFYFGTKKRAPQIFRLIGLEWLHRLITEPGRLWKRYLIGIPSFLFQIIKLKLSSEGNNYQKNGTFK
ncbi:MAG: WecB/TagA/CpsF family glycosyltransferase [Ignavibacteriaceae bacterium]|nr:WecB/TagA/CpsF family glycosyltransferase [Ignavibacteriaceae bacterium]MCW9094528.1 WecB/TagA/CpsF family glycosyltransferase [Ignavibacteriaceae bacterium]